jgi:hypothetical protein
MEKKTKIILVVGVVAVVCIILLSVFVVPFIGYYRISEGMTELEVKNILGEPKYNQTFNRSVPFFGPPPNLPTNMTFRALSYFISDQVVGIILVSSSDYSKLTGKNIEDNLWRVAEKNMHPSSWTS